MNEITNKILRKESNGVIVSGVQALVRKAV